MAAQDDAGVGRLTIAEIVTGLEAERDRAASSKKGHWVRLIELARQLDSQRTESALTRHRWRLVTCSITDFRGVAGTLSVNFRSEADVTVFYGENGAGKSSLTAAIRMAVEGVVGVTHAGVPIKSAKALWISGDDRHRGASSSRVQIGFAAADEPSTQLELTAEYDGVVVARSAVVTSADGHSVVFDAADPAWDAWDAAVRSAPPVFAYAELADELKAQGDLQAWITKCLAMDVASRELDGAVATAVSSAGAAEKQLRDEIEAAATSIEHIDAQARIDGVVGIAPIAWGELFQVEDLDTWRKENILETAVQSEERLPAELIESVDGLLERFRGLRSTWNAAATVLITTEVGQGLVALSKAVDHSHQGDNGRSCPLCGQTSPDWRKRLALQADRFADAAGAWGAVKALLHASARPVLAPLELAARSSMVEAAPDGAADDRMGVAAACERLLAVTHGERADVDLVNDFDALNRAWTDSVRSAISITVRRSDRRASWKAERSIAASAVFAAFEEHIEDARSHGQWKSARALWNPFLANLRNARALRLEGQFSLHLREMLADVGFNLDRLDVKKNETRIDIADSSGQRVELSYLSAGQRNALILAPILAQSGIGLFDFIFIDDPVHAFDEFRVDRLAATLVRIGADRPLIITTHDGRFVQYLRAHLPERYTVVRVQRRPNGTIDLNDTEAPWTVLFTHAGVLLDQATSTTATAARDVCALLRMGFDAALESFVYRALSERLPEERSAVLSSFEGASTTTARLQVARNLATDMGRFDTAVDPIKDCLMAWSTGVHAGTSHDAELTEQLRLARRSAKELARL